MLALPLPRLKYVMRKASRIPPIFVALAAQLLALIFTGLLMRTLPHASLSVVGALALASLMAAAFSFIFRMRAWWLVLQAGFLPALYVAYQADIAPFWYLAGFALLALTYGATFLTQVPLYNSRPHVWQAVTEHLPLKENLRFLDIGSGLGGLLAYMAATRRDVSVTGIEAAPLPFWISKIRLSSKSNARVCWGDFWQHNLADYDVVFAYLSPVAMPALWEKARKEMRPGALLISYRFVVPNMAPTEVITLADLGRTRLYVWRL